MLTKEGYKERIVDKQISDYLKAFGAVCIEGPKWCGKTWSALNHSKSVYYVGDPTNNFRNRELAKINSSLLYEGENPRLIDEWQEIPSIWDGVRFKADEDIKNGKYILTGSSTPTKKGVMHSGTGRIGILKMYPMSLYESNESTGTISLKDLFDGIFNESMKEETKLEDIVKYIIRGGWPKSLIIPEDVVNLLPKSYLDSVLNEDMAKIDGVKRDRNKMEKILKSLARNESTLVNNQTLLNDINKDENVISINTLTDYLDVLERLFIINYQNYYSPNIRSSVRVSKSPKRHFVDPSLACAALNITKDMLLQDLNTLGFLFESLVERDLKIYAESIGGQLFHYRDNSGKEIDAIIEMPNGKWGAFEIKLSEETIDITASKLIKFSNLMNDKKSKPCILGIIVGLGGVAYQREDGVYVIPITALKN